MPEIGDKSTLLNQLRIDRGSPKTPVLPARLPWLGAGAGLIVVLAGAWFILASPSGVAVHAVVARQLASSSPSGGSSASLLDASGYVVALRQAAVSGKSVYKVVDVLIEAGQLVQKDEVIARFDDTNNHAAMAQAEAQVKAAEATFAAARLAYTDAAPIYARNKKLMAAGWLSHDAFDTSRASYDAAQANLTVAERQLDVTRGGLEVSRRYEDDTVIRAPFTGIVTVKNAQPGEIVSPQFLGGGGVATIVDMDSLEVQVDVSENFISRVHSEQRAVIRLNAYPDWDIPAHVIAVIPTADQTKATVKVRVAFEQRDQRILPQMGARVSFLEDRTPTAAASATMERVVLPPDAVQTNGAVGTVFIIDGDHVERRAVRLGARGAEGQTILSGVQAGRKVAVGDLGRLSDGARIHIEQ